MVVPTGSPAGTHPTCVSACGEGCTVAKRAEYHSPVFAEVPAASRFPQSRHSPTSLGIGSKPITPLAWQ